jgi:hypothetical protein
MTNDQEPSTACSEEVAQHGVSGIVQRFQMSDLDILLKDQMSEILEKAARVARPNDQAIAIRQLDTHDIGLIQ